MVQCVPTTSVFKAAIETVFTDNTITVSFINVRKDDLPKRGFALLRMRFLEY
jgi:hypothetical protein